MQGGRDPFFGFGDPFGGFGRQMSSASEFFGGRNPFDDPFFRSPFGGMFESSIFGPNGGPFMNPNNGGPFMNPHIGVPFMNPRASGFPEHQPPQPNRSRGPIIEELSSDDEKDEKESGEEKKENPRKHGRSCKEPIVEDPDDEAIEKKSKHMARWNDMNQMQHAILQPEVNSFTFQSSSVSYGGANGAFYTTSTTRRSGTDGLSFEEFKEADSSTRQATHRVSKGIHDKGHSVTRKLKSDGHVDTMQTLHNLNQDELTGFGQAWNGNAKKHLPGWREESSSRDVMRRGRIGDGGVRPLPCIENPNNLGNARQEVGGMAGPPQPDVGDRTGGGRSNRGSSSHKGNRHY